MDDVTLLQILIANGVILLGSCLQGIAGYGIGTLSAPLLFLISPLFIPGPLTLNALLLTVFMLMRDRTSLQLRAVRFAVGGGVLGTIAAAITLIWLTATGFELIFGVLILVGVALSVAGLRPRLTARNSFMAGAASSYMGTITAVGGPAIAMVYQNEKGPLIRANLSAFFLLATFLTLAALVASGYLGTRELLLALSMAPGTVIGFGLSGRLVHRVPIQAMRPIILSIAGVAGAAALIRGSLALLG